MDTKTEKTTSSDLLLEVALIGAGPSGIIAARQLVGVCGFTVTKSQSLGVSNTSTQGSIAIFEETDSVGGVWTRDPKRQRQTVPCSCQDSETSEVIEVSSSSQPIYEDLNANFPKDMTSFTDHPFPSDMRFFPTPEEVGNYYQGYAKLHGLDKSIHFNTRVEKCWKENNDKHKDVWHIQVQTTNPEGKKEDKVFQSKRLLVCSGHYRKAFAPDIWGLRHFQGEIHHSSSFQTSKAFQGKSVLIVGGGISGNDIADVLSKYGGCKQVAVSVRKWSGVHKALFKKMRKDRGVVIRPGINRISENGSVCFKARFEEDGHDNGGCESLTCQFETPDAIIFATGYRYWYPYLPSGNYLSAGGYKMNHLYMRVLHIDDPSLAFIGVTNFNLSPAIMMEYQSKWYAKVVVKEKRDFARIDMEKEADNHDNDGTQEKLLFNFPSYCNSLASMSGDRGYWKQLLLLRLSWHIKSLWTRGHPSIYWALGFLVPSTLLTVGGFAVLASKYRQIAK